MIDSRFPPDRRWLARRGLFWSVLIVVLGGPATAQIPAPRLDAAPATDFAARRAAILRDEQARRVAAGIPPRALDEGPRPDGSSRFVPLAEVVAAAEARIGNRYPSPAEAALRVDVARQLFDLALEARAPTPSLAFIDGTLRMVLERQPDHAEARRLLGFVPHGSGGWATPFAAKLLNSGKVKDPTFGWVDADWVPHLTRGELPAPGGSKKWLPADQADALRRDWRKPWNISTEHFEVYANVPLREVIAFGVQLETLDALFQSVMADLIGPQQLPLARRLDARDKGQPAPAPRKGHQVRYFSNRAEYTEFLLPFNAAGAKFSLGMYIPKKDSPHFGRSSYFFRDPGGQLDVGSTLFHEASHQLLFESGEDDQYARNVGNFWVFEGLGTYFETVQVEPDGSLRVGGLVGPRIANARDRLIDAHELVPLDLFVPMRKEAFLDDLSIRLHYAESMALAVFLMQADDERYREPFLDYARDAYKGQFRGGRGTPLDIRLGRPYADLQRDFLLYLGRVAPAPGAGPQR